MAGPVNLGALRSPDLADRHPLLAVPVGSIEQHGPHLPLDTDTTIAVELCRRLAERVPDVVVGPAIGYGSSGEHAGFPGTLSVGGQALRLLLVELIRSADAFGGVVLVNGHGGNLAAINSAVALCRDEGRHVIVWSPTGPSADTHAGHTETSVLLHLRPADVDLPAATPGVIAPLPTIMNRLRTGGVRAVSPTGVLGDPTTATAEAGVTILDRWTADLVRTVARHSR